MAIEFWFDFASTYSYLAASRIEDMATARGVPLEWRAFLLGPIFQDQGWNDSPFNMFPARGRLRLARGPSRRPLRSGTRRAEGPGAVC
jgi:2-hydroxychromene-2-carboxylate isomerase